MNFEATYSAKISRASVFRWRIAVELPDGDSCEVSGGIYKLSGEFELGNQQFSFDGERLLLGDEALVAYNYSSGLMGIGEELALSDLEGEFVLACRPTGRGKIVIASASETVGEVTWSLFGQQFTANTRQDLPTEYVLLCLWVAMTRMVRS